jgi:hypothetical protein
LIWQLRFADHETHVARCARSKPAVATRRRPTFKAANNKGTDNTMQQFPNFGDQRNQGWRVFCGGPMETRDHAPSRVFLDEPYPDNLPVVSSCKECNQSFALDEEYLACLIECARTGSVEQARSTRPKIAKTLARKASLESRLAAARVEAPDAIDWKPEEERVRNVIVKLAKAHVAYEQNEPQLNDPTSVSVIPLCAMTADATHASSRRGEAVPASARN